VKVLAVASRQRSALLPELPTMAEAGVPGVVAATDYALYAHCALARKAGLSDVAVTTLANAGIPDDLSEHEKIAARLAHQLSTSHRVDDELYREAEHAFGTTGLFDIAALMGQYHTVCTALTLFEVPAPN